MIVGNVYAGDVTDELTWESLGLNASNNNYAEYTGIKISSDAVYTAQASSGKGQYIQLRTNNSNSGIVTTTSGGKLKSVTITFNSATTDRAIEIYGKNEAYSAASDLYGDAKGTLLKTIAASDDSKTLIVDGDYTFVGLKSSSGAIYVDKIDITWEASGSTPVTVAAPTISGTTPFVGSTQVTIENNEDGAKVYYTTNGDAPTASSTEYSAPFTITETTTVKAIAVKGSTSSSVASKTFTAVPSVANIAALNALQNNDAFAFAGEALVVYVSGKYAYIKDETGSSLVFDNGSTKLANLALGKKIAANWTGKVSIYKNLFEAVPDAVLTVTDDEAIAVTYPVAEISDVTATNMNQVVVLKDVVYSALDGKNFKITKGETEVKGYNQFGLTIDEPVAGKSYDITGVISVYGDDVQFQPIEIQEVSWTIAGTAPLVTTSWDPTDASADMTSTDGVNFTYVKEGITLEKGVTKEFKVARNHSWNEAYPGDNYPVSVDETAEYKVTITFNALTKNITVETEKTGSGQVGEKVYSVIGTINGNWDTDTDMTKGDDGLYKAEFTNIAKGTYKLKVRVNHDWSENYGGGDDTDGNSVFEVESDGSTVIVTFNEETKVVAITVSAATGISTAKVVELNGAVYNVAGQMVTSSYKGLVIKNGKKMIQK